jgi:hypothetical protein
MSRVLTVSTISGRRGKIKLDECTTWEERRPKKTYVIYLHRTPNGKLFEEHRYVKSKFRSFCIEIRVEWAVHWLVDEEHEVPGDCGHLDDRTDLAREESPDASPLISNFCLNCLRQSRTKRNRPKTEYESAILAVVEPDIPKIGRIIAEQAGLPFNSHFRSTLARLVASHVIENVGRHRGYRKSRVLS